MSGAEPRLAAKHGVNLERRQSTTAQRKNWAPACEPGAYQRVDLNGEGRVTVDKRIVPAVEALNAVLKTHGYATRRADTGAYVCRQITGGTGYSLHAYGIAIDINWSTNPYGKRLVTDMLGADGQDRSMVDAILAIRTTNGARVWEWGGDWSGNKDAMHYEIDCTPADLATGLAGQDPEEGFTMDTEAREAFAALNKRLDAQDKKVDRLLADAKDKTGRLAGIQSRADSILARVKGKN